MNLNVQPIDEYFGFIVLLVGLPFIIFYLNEYRQECIQVRVIQGLLTRATILAKEAALLSDCRLPFQDTSEKCRLAKTCLYRALDVQVDRCYLKDECSVLLQRIDSIEKRVRIQTL